MLLKNSGFSRQLHLEVSFSAAPWISKLTERERNIVYCLFVQTHYLLGQHKPSQTTQTWALWPLGPWVQFCGCKEVRAVKGEVIGEKQMWGNIIWGRERLDLLTRLQLFLNNCDIMMWTLKKYTHPTLWHVDPITSSTFMGRKKHYWSTNFV